MRIAVVGSGIGGLGAAWLLSRAHEVDLYDRDDRVGGHAHTVPVPGVAGGVLGLDTGFLVHNEVTYPHLVRAFRELGVRTQDSEMGFSVSCARCDLEYSGVALHRQAALLARPGFRRLVGDLVRFQRRATRALDADHSGATLRDFVREEGYSRTFVDHYLMPFTASIWSSGSADAMDFPAAYAVRFWRNHGLLGFRRLRWRTVSGGSVNYVKRMVEPLADRVHLGRPVTEVRRHPDGVEVRAEGGPARRYDHVVLAAHPGQSLAMLADPSDAERRVLGAFRYTTSEAVLHTDPRMLPARAVARSSWNYHLADCRAPHARPAITYSLNRLQAIHEGPEYCVTLNRGDEIDPARVIRRVRYDHPAYTFDALRAQGELRGLQGRRRTWYSGAWTGYGFHEDGMRAAVGVARGLGVDW
jgi:predicted NAD/FAD-binding protein